eukprot:87825-Lingulodinium_polyedra.AAC.1
MRQSAFRNWKPAETEKSINHEAEGDRRATNRPPGSPWMRRSLVELNPPNQTSAGICQTC